MKRSRLSFLLLLPMLALGACGSDDAEPAEPSPSATAAPTEEAEPEEAVADQVAAAFTESYGWPDDEAWSDVDSITQEGLTRITVVSNLADKAENEDRAMQLCQAVSSVAGDVEDPPRTINVTAGEGGAFLAECTPFTG